ncbi:MAG: DUF1697 domain-containing protein [Eubacteriaceae bacterium]
MKKVAFLRGINVGKHNRINMKALVEALEKYEYEEVKTYIQSGNVIFGKAGKESIEEVINKEFGFEIKVIIRSKRALETLLDSNPFLDNLTYITFLSKKPEYELNDIENPQKNGDCFKIEGDNVLLEIQKEYHKTKFSNAFFEKKLGVDGTTRNLKTLKEIVRQMNS